MTKIVWDENAVKITFVNEELKKKIEDYIDKANIKELMSLKEYEETGDERIIPVIDPSGGSYIKIVKHKGKLKLIAGVWEHGYAEEYFIGVLVIGK